MTAAELEAAVLLAEECMYRGGADYNECDMSSLAAALIALAEDRARLAKVVEAAQHLLNSAQRTHQGFADEPEYSANRIIAELGPALAALTAQGKGEP